MAAESPAHQGVVGWGVRMGRIIRRRVRHAHWVGDGPVGLVERGDDFTRAEVDWFMRRLQRS